MSVWGGVWGDVGVGVGDERGGGGMKGGGRTDSRKTSVWGSVFGECTDLNIFVLNSFFLRGRGVVRVLFLSRFLFRGLVYTRRHLIAVATSDDTLAIEDETQRTCKKPDLVARVYLHYYELRVPP